MCGTKREVGMLVDLNESHSAILSVNQCVTRPEWHESLSIDLDVLDSDWSTKR